MASRLADRLNAARHRRFVGRHEEIQLFRSALASPALHFHVLHIHGPGGVGKTTLLREYLSACEEHGVGAAYLDACEIEPTPPTFTAALATSLRIAAGRNPSEAIKDHSGRFVLILDTYEALTPLDGWLRDVFLPELPDDVLVVMAARNPPLSGWRIDAGWQSLLRVVALRNLSPAESRQYLKQRSIPDERHDAVLRFTHGHPLALSLLADVLDQRPQTTFQPEQAPDVIKALIDHFIQKVPSPLHRSALEAAALLRMMTEPLLAHVLELENAHEIFDWLRGLSIAESRPFGLVLHDLAREALAADLRWRNPEWFAILHERSRLYYADRLRKVSGIEQQRVLYDYLYLHRDNPVIRPFFEWHDSAAAIADAAQPGDLPILTQIVERHEGPEAAELAGIWFQRQPENVLVFRTATQHPAALLLLLDLTAATQEDLDRDPATRNALEYLSRSAPLRQGERATFFRFWMSEDEYQSVSSLQSLIFIHIARHYLTTSNLAFTFFPVADPDFWGPLCAYIDIFRIDSAEFTVGGRSYAVFGHDWRTVPGEAWLALLAEREIAMTPAAPPARPEPVLVLSDSEFAVYVREALRHFSRPDRMVSNPLLRSRLINDAGGAGSDTAERIETLRMLLRGAAERMKASPRDEKLFDVLERTFFRPARSQEQAAELLNLPFSTYRRHLKSAVNQVTTSLWQQELRGPLRLG